MCRNRSDLYDYGQISDYFSQNGRILVGFNQKRSDFSFKSAATIENGILCQKREKFKAI